MEKLLPTRKCMIYASICEILNASASQICRWVFLDIAFSKNINGWTLYHPSIASTFSSNIRAIPDKLLPSRACFCLHEQYSAKIETHEKKTTIIVGLIFL